MTEKNAVLPPDAPTAVLASPLREGDTVRRSVARTAVVARRAIALALHVVAALAWFTAYALRQLAAAVEPAPESTTAPRDVSPRAPVDVPSGDDVTPPGGRQISEHERQLWLLAIHRARHHDVPSA